MSCLLHGNAHGSLGEGPLMLLPRCGAQLQSALASCTDGKHVAILCLKQTVALVLNATAFLSTVWAAVLFVQTHLVVWHLSVRQLSRDYFSSNNVALDNSPISQREKNKQAPGVQKKLMQEWLVCNLKVEKRGGRMTATVVMITAEPSFTGSLNTMSVPLLCLELAGTKLVGTKLVGIKQTEGSAHRWLLT